MASWTRPDDSSPAKKNVCSAGNTSVTRSAGSSLRACATRKATCLDRYNSFTMLKWRKSSSHWGPESSLTPCQGGKTRGLTRIFRHVKGERVCKHKDQTCARYESRNSDS